MRDCLKWAVLLGALLGAPSAAAQPAAPSRFSRPAAAVNRPFGQNETGSLAAHLAVAVAERLLASDDPDDRLRGVDRLAGSSQREAIDRLVRALADGTTALRDPRARLAAVRGLAPFATRESVREVLSKTLSTEPGAPLMALVRDTAALALAASGDARSLEVLGAALRQGGATAEAAEQALVAYPPASLVPLGVGREELPAAVCDLLGRLGDQRAVGALRAALVHGLARGDSGEGSTHDESRQAKAAAAIALARLGDQEQVAVARSWLASGDLWLQLKGAEVLLLSGAAGARQYLPPLLSSPPTRSAALRLAVRSLGADLLPAIGELADTTDDSGKTAVVLLGRLGGASAVAQLETLLRVPSRAWEAAFALARSPGDQANRALESALSNPALARLAARAATVRALAIGQTPTGLEATLRSLLASNEPADRAAGAFGLAALRKVSMAELVASRDPVVVRAAARASLPLGGEAAKAIADRLAVETDGATRNALAIALAGPTEALAAVSTHQLVAWAESDEPIAPLSLVALGAREESGDEHRLARWSQSSDPVLRAHAALALASSPLPNAVSRLAQAWRFEPDRDVRRAIAVALSQRGEFQRIAFLEIVARIDPDLEVREMASLGLVGRLPDPRARMGAGCAGARAKVGGCYVAWILLAPSSVAPAASAGVRAGALVDSSGLSLPVVGDPDGALVVPGVSPGNASFRLASSPLWYDDLGHERSQAEPSR